MNFIESIKNIYSKYNNKECIKDSFFVYSFLSDLIGSSFEDKKVLSYFKIINKKINLFELVEKENIKSFLKILDRHYNDFKNDLDSDSYKLCLREFVSAFDDSYFKDTPLKAASIQKAAILKPVVATPASHGNNVNVKPISPPLRVQPQIKQLQNQNNQNNVNLNNQKIYVNPAAIQQNHFNQHQQILSPNQAYSLDLTNVWEIYVNARNVKVMVTNSDLNYVLLSTKSALPQNNITYTLTKDYSFKCLILDANIPNVKDEVSLFLLINTKKLKSIIVNNYYNQVNVDVNIPNLLVNSTSNVTVSGKIGKVNVNTSQKIFVNGTFKSLYLKSHSDNINFRGTADLVHAKTNLGNINIYGAANKIKCWYIHGKPSVHFNLVKYKLKQYPDSNKYHYCEYTKV